jgi:hypothetical protein
MKAFLLGIGLPRTLRHRPSGATAASGCEEDRNHGDQEL